MIGGHLATTVWESRRSTMSKQRIPPRQGECKESDSAPDIAKPRDADARDIWGRPIAYDEAPEEEAARLLMSLNWLCDIVDYSRRNPDTADRNLLECGEMIARLTASCRSPELRKGLADAAVSIAGRRYREALGILRSLSR